MKRIIYIILTLLLLPLAAVGEKKVNALDRLFQENPELIPETIMVRKCLPRMTTNDTLFQRVLTHISSQLQRYSSDVNIVLYASQYNCSTYHFRLVTPMENAPFEIQKISSSQCDAPTLIGYTNVDSLYLLIDENVSSSFECGDNITSVFDLKLLRCMIDDGQFEWWITKRDSDVKSFSILNQKSLPYSVEQHLRNCVDRMKEHRILHNIQ